ncbi:MAG: hypothetical protein UT34_C0002G0066 [candidate division WS6 bacterium GW2011_GWF2_39_15]|uniref:SprT-like domain-containing protein n=1 Tax=candidate division WS6 bacterium GW2011_GWF2_39_15 TaxID=1619100 RepID=A0A0G0MN93_9BACT|nr:MAG: hypothetical protein UT34_C0002G0066 [candidate division WS6 bacterium GW2011_GWF2_39_15]
MRDNQYLIVLLEAIWNRYFADVPRVNKVSIRFGKHSYRQLGAIKSKRGDDSESKIVLTRFFMSPEIPEHVLISTIAHEIVHYSHGFNSPLPKLYSDPHRGNIVEKDLTKRGLEKELTLSKQWLKENWSIIVTPRLSQRRRLRRRFLIFSF